MTPQRLHRQRGNTLTGIIIGLIIGLGIAVVVALAITKGANPFTDKGSKAGKTELPPGQAADPNKPLYGNRDAAREANKALQAKAKPADDPLGAAIAGMNGQPAPAPAPATATAPAPAAPAAASAHPPAAAVNGTPAAVPAAPAAAPKVEGEVVYYLQAGAFKEMTDAEGSRAKLALLGFEATISDRTTDGGVLHRVRIGPFAQAEAMNKARAKLSEAGVDVAIVRNQR